MISEEIQLGVRNRVREYYQQAYGEILDRVIADANTAKSAERFVFLGPSCILFTTKETRWIIDPSFRITPTPDIRDSLFDKLDAALEKVDYAFITHEDPDHFDPVIVKRYTDIHWFIPDFMKDRCVQPAEHITFVRADEEIPLKGLRVSAYRGMHYDHGTTKGLPEIGYLFQTGAYRIMTPGDVRDYDPALFPDFESITHFFLNVWLGRNNACHVDESDFLDQASSFAAHWQPQNVIMGHLMEVSRDADNLWTYRHAGMLMDAIVARMPACDVRILRPGRVSFL